MKYTIVMSATTFPSLECSFLRLSTSILLILVLDFQCSMDTVRWRTLRKAAQRVDDASSPSKGSTSLLAAGRGGRIRTCSTCMALCYDMTPPRMAYGVKRRCLLSLRTPRRSTSRIRFSSAVRTPITLHRTMGIPAQGTKVVDPDRYPAYPMPEPYQGQPHSEDLQGPGVLEQRVPGREIYVYHGPGGSTYTFGGSSFKFRSAMKVHYSINNDNEMHFFVPGCRQTMRLAAYSLLCEYR